ncbi:MAG: TIGR03086 family metal-binding protein [Acidimicrobiales bacterium]
MDELIELHRLSAAEFAGRVERLGEADWRRPTPCDGWDVRQLVDHVVRFNLYVSALLDGLTIADVALPDDVLGRDPAAVTLESVRTAQAAFERPGALDGLVHHPAADIPGSLFLVFRVFDFVVHGWDLAQGVGAVFETGPTLLAFTLTQARELEGAMAASGLFAPPRPLASDADPMSEILARTGRTG